MAAQIALDGFSAVDEVNAGEKPPALPPPAAPGKEPGKEPLAEKPRADRDPERRPAEGPAPVPQRPPETVVEVKAPPGAEAQDWGPAYRAVTEALTLRDRIAPTAGPDDQAALQRAQLNLGRARGAWKQRDHAAAREYAQSAVADYTGVARAIRERAQQNAPRDKEALNREADAALREAKVALEICERERCDDRENADFLRGKGLYESARKANDAGDQSYALEMARQARRALDEVVQKPRKNPPPAPVDPKELERKQQEAEAAMREANIAHELCKKEGCERVDQENWLRAEQLLAAARRNQAASNHDQTRELAGQSQALFRKIYDSKPRFKVPDGITRVVQRDGQLVLVPPPEFERNNASKLTAKSLEAIKELAAVLKANQASIKLVRLVGYTDNRGSAAANKSLSAGRARTLLQALVAEGVPLAMLVSEGRGPDNPVADNNTNEGRLANRRVEIVLELK